MSQQSDFADAIYQRLNNGPIPLADLIRTISFRWGPEHGASEINLFVLEAVTCLLQYEEVETGNLLDGTFVSWAMPPCEAEGKVESLLSSSVDSQLCEHLCVFRKRA